MRKKKVIIIDDEKLFLKIIKINLERTGSYEVETVSDATDILSLIRSFNPDIILLDILMPKIDGVETCKMLNADPVGKRIPVVVLSAFDTDKARLMMHKLGVADFLIKPIGMDELISGIEKALKRKPRLTS